MSIIDFAAIGPEQGFRSIAESHDTPKDCSKHYDSSLNSVIVYDNKLFSDHFADRSYFGFVSSSVAALMVGGGRNSILNYFSPHIFQKYCLRWCRYDWSMSASACLNVVALAQGPSLLVIDTGKNRILWKVDVSVQLGRGLSFTRQLISWSPDSRCIATSMEDGGVCIHHGGTGELLYNIPTPSIPLNLRQSSSISGLSFLPLGSKFSSTYVYQVILRFNGLLEFYLFEYSENIEMMLLSSKNVFISRWHPYESCLSTGLFSNKMLISDARKVTIWEICTSEIERTVCIDDSSLKPIQIIDLESISGFKLSICHERDLNPGSPPSKIVSYLFRGFSVCPPPIVQFVINPISQFGALLSGSGHVTVVNFGENFDKKDKNSGIFRISRDDWIGCDDNNGKMETNDFVTCIDWWSSKVILGLTNNGQILFQCIEKSVEGNNVPISPPKLGPNLKIICAGNGNSAVLLQQGKGGARVVIMEQISVKLAISRRLESNLIEEALSLTKRYDLNEDIVHKELWERALKSESNSIAAAISEFLSKVSDDRWVFLQVLEHAKELILPTEAVSLLKLGISRIDRYSLKTELNCETDNEELQRIRKEILHILALSETYMTLTKKYKQEVVSSIPTFSFFVKIGTFRICQLLAADGNIEGLGLVLIKHGEILCANNKMEILACIPEIIHPDRYMHLVPIDDTTSDQLIQWCVNRAVRIAESGASVSIAISLCSLIFDQINRTKIDRTPLLDELGQLQVELQYLESFLYAQKVSINITFKEWQSMNWKDRCKMILSKSTIDSLKLDVQALFLAAEKLQLKLEDDSNPGYILAELLGSKIEKYPSLLIMELSVEVALGSKPDVIYENRILKSDQKLAELFLSVAYAWKDDRFDGSVMEALWQIIECMPVQGANWPPNLQHRVDTLESQLTASAILEPHISHYIPPFSYLEAGNDPLDPQPERFAIFCKGIVEAACSKTVQSSSLLNDLFTLKNRIMPYLSDDFLLRSALEALVRLNDFKAAKLAIASVQSLPGYEGYFPKEAIESSLLAAAQEVYNSASTIGEFEYAEIDNCLSLISWPCEAILQEKNLAKALHMISKMGCDIIPLQLRLELEKRQNPLQVFETILKGLPSVSQIAVPESADTFDGEILERSSSSSRDSNSAYNLSESLVKISNLLGFKTEIEFNRVRLLVARHALSANDMESGLSILKTMVHAALKRQIFVVPEVVHLIMEILSKRPEISISTEIGGLCGMALCVCDPLNLPHLTSLWGSLPLQTREKSVNLRILYHSNNIEAFDKILISTFVAEMRHDYVESSDALLNLLSVSDSNMVLNMFSELEVEADTWEKDSPQIAGLSTSKQVKQPMVDEDYSFIDENLLNTLQKRGFSKNGARRACVATKNEGLEPALQWCFAHSQDPDFDLPYVISRGRKVPETPTEPSLNPAEQLRNRIQASKVSYAALEILSRIIEDPKTMEDYYCCTLNELVCIVREKENRGDFDRCSSKFSDLWACLNTGKDKDESDSELRQLIPDMNLLKLKEDRGYQEHVLMMLFSSLSDQALFAGIRLSEEKNYDTWSLLLFRMRTIFKFRNSNPFCDFGACITSKLYVNLPHSLSTGTIWEYLLQNPPVLLESLSSIFQECHGTDILQIDLILRLALEAIDSKNNSQAYKKVQNLSSLGRRLLRSTSLLNFDFKYVTGTENFTSFNAIHENSIDKNELSIRAGRMLRACIELGQVPNFVKIAPRLGLSASSVYVSYALRVLTGSIITLENLNFVSEDDDDHFSVLSLAVSTEIISHFGGFNAVDLMNFAILVALPTIADQIKLDRDLPNSSDKMVPIRLSLLHRKKFVSEAINALDGSENMDTKQTLIRICHVLNAMSYVPTAFYEKIEQLWLQKVPSPLVMSTLVDILLSNTNFNTIESVMRELSVALSSAISDPVIYLPKVFDAAVDTLLSKLCDGSLLSDSSIVSGSPVLSNLLINDSEIDTLQIIQKLCLLVCEENQNELKRHSWKAVRSKVILFCSNTSPFSLKLLEMIKALDEKCGAAVDHLGQDGLNVLRIKDLIARNFDLSIENFIGKLSCEKCGDILDFLLPMATSNSRRLRTLLDIVLICNEEIRKQFLKVDYMSIRLGLMLYPFSSPTSPSIPLPEKSYIWIRRALDAFSEAGDWPLIMAVVRDFKGPGWGIDEGWERKLIQRFVGVNAPPDVIYTFGLSSTLVSTHFEIAKLMIDWNWGGISNADVLWRLLASPILVEVAQLPCFQVAINLAMEYALSKTSDFDAKLAVFEDINMHSFASNILRISALLTNSGLIPEAGGLICAALGIHPSLRSLSTSKLLLHRCLELTYRGDFSSLPSSMQIDFFQTSPVNKGGIYDSWLKLLLAAMETLNEYDR